MVESAVAAFWTINPNLPLTPCIDHKCGWGSCNFLLSVLLYCLHLCKVHRHKRASGEKKKYEFTSIVQTKSHQKHISNALDLDCSKNKTQPITFNGRSKTLWEKSYFEPRHSSIFGNVSKKCSRNQWRLKKTKKDEVLETNISKKCLWSSHLTQKWQEGTVWEWRWTEDLSDFSVLSSGSLWPSLIPAAWRIPLKTLTSPEPWPVHQSSPWHSPHSLCPPLPSLPRALIPLTPSCRPPPENIASVGQKDGGEMRRRCQLTLPLLQTKVAEQI